MCCVRHQREIVYGLSSDKRCFTIRHDPFFFLLFFSCLAQFIRAVYSLANAFAVQINGKYIINLLCALAHHDRAAIWVVNGQLERAARIN